MNSLWDIRIFLGLVPKESPCIILLYRDNLKIIYTLKFEDLFSAITEECFGFYHLWLMNAGKYTCLRSQCFFPILLNHFISVIM